MKVIILIYLVCSNYTNLDFLNKLILGVSEMVYHFMYKVKQRFAHRVEKNDLHVYE